MAELEDLVPEYHSVFAGLIKGAEPRNIARRISVHDAQGVDIIPFGKCAFQPCRLSLICLQYRWRSSGTSAGQTPHSRFPGTA